MHSIVTLVLAITGIILLALDRVVGKERMIRFDENLAHFVRGFRILQGYSYLPVLILASILMMVKVVEPQLRAEALVDPALAENRVAILLLDNWRWLLPLVALIMIMGSDLWKWVRGKRRSLKFWKTMGLSLLVSLFMPIYLSLRCLVLLVHLALCSMIYPLKGVLLLNQRWFNSFSGVIGLLVALLATILQFTGF